MRYIQEKLFFMACFTAVMLSMPALLNAAAAISLDGPEMKRIARGEIVVREIAAAGKRGRTLEAVGLVKASRKNVLRVLTEYKKYPEFMPNVSRIDIVEQRGSDAVLNYTLSLPMGKIKKYRLKIAESASGTQTSLLEWQMLKWPGLNVEETIADTTGYWRIEEKSGNSSLLLYHVYTDPGPIPFGLGWIVDVLTKKSVPDVLLQTRKRAERLPVR